MIESGKYLELINEKVAILSYEIGRSGRLTFLNIHKQCENLIRRILNIAFGYQFDDLNDGINNFSGLDIGDKKNSLAFQISSDKSSGKVNDALEKVIKYGHYKIFKNIRMFVLGYKQDSYTITVTTAPHFDFDWKTDIWDFDTLMLKLRPLDVDKLKATYDLIVKELPYTIEVLREGEKANPVIEKDTEKKSVTLLDINKTLKQKGFLFYEHWVCNIKIKGMSIPPAKLYSSLEGFLNKQEKRQFLSVFNKAFQKKVDGREVIFHHGPSATGVVDHSDERILRMSNSLLQLEYAQYRPKVELFSPFNDELLTTTVLIFFCQWLYAGRKMDIDVEATISTNGRLLYLYRSPSVFSIISVLNSLNVYELDPNDVHFSRALEDSSNDSLRGLYEDLTYGMVTKDDHPLVGRPFMELNVNDQYIAFDYLRKLLLG